jgi:hypothetical protein
MHLTKWRYGLLSGLMMTALLAMTAARPNRSDPMTVPEHTLIHVTLDQSLASNQCRPGDHFEATVSKPIVIADKTVISQGARVEGLVVDARHSGRLTGRARLQLALQTVEVGGKYYEIRTASAQKVGGNHKKRNIAWIGGGAGGGLLIGALVAGGEGALIGGPVGAGAGTAAAFLTGKKDIKLPAETPLAFKLAEPGHGRRERLVSSIIFYLFIYRVRRTGKTSPAMGRGRPSSFSKP